MTSPTLDSGALHQRRWAVCGLVLLLIPPLYAWVDLPLTEALVNAPFGSGSSFVSSICSAMVSLMPMQAW